MRGPVGLVPGNIPEVEVRAVWWPCADLDPFGASKMSTNICHGIRTVLRISIRVEAEMTHVEYPSYFKLEFPVADPTTGAVKGST